MSLYDLERDLGITDRVDLAFELFELAGRIEDEAARWRHPAMVLTRATLGAAQRILATLAQKVLRDDIEHAVAEAYRDAAFEQLKRIIGMRHRLEHLRRRSGGQL